MAKFLSLLHTVVILGLMVLISRTQSQMMPALGYPGPQQGYPNPQHQAMYPPQPAPPMRLPPPPPVAGAIGPPLPPAQVPPQTSWLPVPPPTDVLSTFLFPYRLIWFVAKLLMRTFLV
ncbi:uncharacterized protein [Atheta coriaria]|uniref:uncharacterized protein n=1 Tax=Dalotia coriaria TaxID=877792 RepID=UPI0031F46202